MGYSLAHVSAAVQDRGRDRHRQRLARRMRRRRLHRPPTTCRANVTQQSITIYSATTPASGTTAADAGPAHRRARQDRPRRGSGTDVCRPAQSDRPRAAPERLPRQLPRHPRSVGGRRYGTLYGPNVDVNGVATAGEGLIPGREYIATLDDGSGKKRVDDGGADPRQLQPGGAVPRPRALVGLARRLRRARDGERVGPQAAAARSRSPMPARASACTT